MSKTDAEYIDELEEIICKQARRISNLESAIGVINTIMEKPSYEPAKRVRFTKIILKCMKEIDVF